MKKYLATILFLFIVSLKAGTEEERTVHYFGLVRTAMVSAPAFSGQTFSVLHAQGGFYGNVTSDLLFRICLDFSNLGSLEERYDTTGNLVGVDVDMPLGLLDAYAAWTFNDNFTIQAGQFKIPYSNSNLRSPANLPFIYRPVTRYATPHSRDIGIKLIWKPAAGSIVVESGVFNGSGLNASDTDKSLNMVGRLEWNISDLHCMSVNLYGGRQDGINMKMMDIGYVLTGDYLEAGAEYALRYDDTIGQQAGYFYISKSFIRSDKKIHKLTPAFRIEWNSFRQDTYTLTGGLTTYLSGQDHSMIRINYGRSYGSGDDFLAILFQVSF